VSRNNRRTDMQHAEIYNGHAGRFQQMARHIELSMTPRHLREHGGPDPISTNDITLATTLLNSVYGYPAGKQAVLALSAGLLPGEERSQTVRGLFRMTTTCSEYDQTLTYTLLPLPGREIETANLLKATAAYSIERAGAHSRQIPPSTQHPVQLER
jgi:hypothetical protein